MMEVFAGFLSHTDHHIGRVLDFLKETGELDNTLVMLVSDNGASPEGGVTGTTNELQFFNKAEEPLADSLKAIDELGGPTTFNHYPWGWTWAGNTPFRRWKRETYRGGASDPFVVHWPKGIKARGEIRTQYAHIIDMVPTVLDALDLEPPVAIRGVAQSPIHGVSLAYSFDDKDADSRHGTQYFEMFGHRSIDHDGWRAVCPWPGPSFAEADKGFGEPISGDTLTELDEKHWELYHVADDPTENHNLAAEHRDILISMIAQWYVEAGRYDVLPIDGSALSRIMTQRPAISEDRTSYTLRPETQTIPPAASPKVLNRKHAITADVEIPEGGAEGVLVCQGSGVGGYSFFIKDGKLRYSHNYVRRAVYRVSSADPVPTGRHELRFEFEPTGQPDVMNGKGTPGLAQLYVDKKLVGATQFDITTPVLFNPGGVTCGANPNLAVDPDYTSPFRFTGTIHTVTIDLSGDLIKDNEGEMKMVLARQ
jgi:hypothetical protein